MISNNFFDYFTGSLSIFILKKKKTIIYTNKLSKQKEKPIRQPKRELNRFSYELKYVYSYAYDRFVLDLWRISKIEKKHLFIFRKVKQTKESPILSGQTKQSWVLMILSSERKLLFFIFFFKELGNFLKSFTEDVAKMYIIKFRLAYWNNSLINSLFFYISIKFLF